MTYYNYSRLYSTSCLEFWFHCFSLSTETKIRPVISIIHPQQQNHFCLILLFSLENKQTKELQNGFSSCIIIGPIILTTIVTNICQYRMFGIVLKCNRGLIKSRKHKKHSENIRGLSTQLYLSYNIDIKTSFTRFIVYPRFFQVSNPHLIDWLNNSWQYDKYYGKWTKRGTVLTNYFVKN